MKYDFQPQDSDPVSFTPLVSYLLTYLNHLLYSFTSGTCLKGVSCIAFEVELLAHNSVVDHRRIQTIDMLDNK